MYDLTIKVCILALALEAVVLVIFFAGWLGTLTQKNLKESESAEAQRKAWVSSDELNKALKINLDEAKKANEEAVSKILMNAAAIKDGFPVPPTSH